VNVRGEAEIDIIQCKGCGTCAAECPARAIDLMHFTTGQLEAKVGALVGGEENVGARRAEPVEG